MRSVEQSSPALDAINPGHGLLVVGFGGAGSGGGSVGSGFLVSAQVFSVCYGAGCDQAV